MKFIVLASSVKTKEVEVIEFHRIEPILDQIIGLLPCKPKCKQILPFEFEEQHSAVSAHFTSQQKLPFAIQDYRDPENPGSIRRTRWMS